MFVVRGRVIPLAAHVFDDVTGRETTSFALEFEEASFFIFLYWLTRGVFFLSLEQNVG